MAFQLETIHQICWPQEKTLWWTQPFIVVCRQANPAVQPDTIIATYNYTKSYELANSILFKNVCQSEPQFLVNAQLADNGTV